MFVYFKAIQVWDERMIILVEVSSRQIFVVTYAEIRQK